MQKWAKVEIGTIKQKYLIKIFSRQINYPSINREKEVQDFVSWAKIAVILPAITVTLTLIVVKALSFIAHLAKFDSNLGLHSWLLLYGGHVFTVA